MACFVRMRARWVKFSLCFILLAGLWFIVHTGYSIYAGTRQPTHPADAAVILGSKVNIDGTLSERLEQRLAAGYELYQRGLVEYLVVSGGLGKEGHYEGDKMRDYLLAQGVPADKIIVDNLGNNTLATAQNLKTLQSQYHFSSVIVVSQYFHVLRSAMLVRRAGFADVQGYSPNYVEWRDIYSVPREFIAFYADWLLH